MPRLLMKTLAALTIFVSAIPMSAQDATRPKRREPKPEVHYPLTADSLKQDDVPQGKLEGPFLFQSKIIENTIRRYWVFVPAQYDPAQAACVLVFQDGARATKPDGVLRVQNVLENLIARKQIPVTIGIFITPGQRGTEFPDSIGTGNPDNRDREYDVLDDRYACFMIDEMLPEVGTKYNLTQDPAGRTIGGSSSGAICAFTVAWHRPEAFRNVVSMIGSFTDIHGGHAYPDLIRLSARKPIRIFLQDGVNDLRNPDNLERDWHIQNQKMVAALVEQEYDCAYVFGDGGHSDDHGGALLPLMLRWVWRDYPGVEDSNIDLIPEAAAIKPEFVELFPGYDSSASVDPTGSWSWERRFGRTAVTSTLTLKLDNDKLSGLLKTQRGNADPVTEFILEPVTDGNKISFDVIQKFGGNEVPMTFHGILEGDTMTGWQLMNFGGQNRDLRWQAKRK